jgi:hypothetical protein
MYAFILLGGASAWYLLYKSCCGKNRAKEDTVEEEPAEVVVKETVEEVEAESHKDACKLVAKKLVDTLIHDVVERIEKREENKNDHKTKLDQVHQELYQHYPKYLHHKVLQELSNKGTEESVDSGTESSAKSDESDESLWNDLGEESVVKERPLYNSRLIYSEEGIDVDQVKYWFSKGGEEHLVSYNQLIDNNGAFNVKRIENDDGNYYFLLFSSKEKQE